MSVQGMRNMAHVPELWRKLGWTFLILLAYRVGIHVPIPGVDTAAMAAFFAQARGTLFGVFDMFSGGGLRNVSIFALGVMPYISASIIMQLLQVLSPDLKRMAKEEGASGRKKITQYTRYGTVLITIVQGFGLATMLESMSSPAGAPMVPEPGAMFRFVTIITMTAGTILIMWLGEQITAKGVGNGISLIIFSGIVAGIPTALIQSYALAGDTIPYVLIPIVIVLMAAITLCVIFIERAQRRIPIHYAKRQQGRRIYGGQTTHLPLRLNTAGVIPPIFAGSLLVFPATIAQFSQTPWLQTFSQWFSPSTVLYNLFYVGLIVFFCYFYTAIIFDPKDIAENLKKQGGFVPGIRPGDKTKEYIDSVLTRITLWGAIYISIVCLLPQFLMSYFNLPFYFGGTSILIVVGVAMDFMSQVNSYMISRQYEGLMGKTKLKGRYQ
ncbi:preprotein translocase subunit SecY [Desulfovibrio sp. OttesenSCG-928-M14]|nr:preprotein translocase subunit SecY [Desulfovibrio sp. OttesenSCG-928-M16]MDL2216157.1 preprotein translocase subunit SecY [Desulfovibrio sp. OttesenSCG-928-M14]MDL2290925.1 preprotein translocase subunit SecY [Desulfovibrio sp. OttesenSCG-928-F20]